MERVTLDLVKNQVSKIPKWQITGDTLGIYLVSEAPDGDAPEAGLAMGVNLRGVVDIANELLKENLTDCKGCAIMNAFELAIKTELETPMSLIMDTLHDVVDTHKNEDSEVVDNKPREVAADIAEKFPFLKRKAG